MHFDPFVNHHCSITARESKSVGAKLEDSYIVCRLLLSLPETALKTLDSEKITIEFVGSRLLDEYNKRGNLDGSAGNGSSRSVGMYSNKQIKSNAFVVTKWDTEVLSAQEMWQAKMSEEILHRSMRDLMTMESMTLRFAVLNTI